MSEKEDYYKILGVAKDANEDEIKKAFRKLARQHHPDLNPGDKQSEERFKEVGEAYAVLVDSEKRRQYDTFGHSAFSGGFGGESPFAGMEGIFGDLFSSFFDLGGGGRSRQKRGEDLKTEVEIDFVEAAKSSKKEIKINFLGECKICGGTGETKDSKRTSCAKCRGRGQVQYHEGFFSITRACPDCGGKGSSIKNPCPSCRGMGRSEDTKKLSLNIPAGIENGTRMRLEGEGNSGGPGGVPGDLYILVRVKPHEIFERHEDDVICEVPITFPQASLGAEIVVPTLDGKNTLKIDPGTQTGKVFRLRGQGFPNLRGYGKGDQLIRIFVETPTRLSTEQAELLRKFAEIGGDRVEPRHEGFFNKMKQLFS
jgi:molecular chaperone DnaJ